MPLTYILDDSIKSPTLILTADHGHIFAWSSPFERPFFHDPPFSAVSKSCNPPSVSTPPSPSPLLISDKSLNTLKMEHRERGKNESPVDLKFISYYCRELSK